MKVDVKLYFRIMAILMLIYGIIMCCTIVGVIFGVPLIVGSNAMRSAERQTNQQLKQNNNLLLVWGIVFGALTTPVGVIAIVFAIIVYNTINEGTDVTIIDVEPEKANPETEELKRKIADLQKLRENGVISDKEYEAMRKKILGI